MSFSKEIKLNLVGAEGDVKVVISPITINVYQNGVKIRKRGAFKPTFLIKTTDGTEEPITIINGSGRVRTAVFRGQQTPLEDKLSTPDLILGVGGFLVIYILGVILFGGVLGLIGGALLGATVGLGIMLVMGFLRNAKGIVSKLIITIGIAACCYLIYFVISMVIAAVLGTILFGFV